MLKLANNENPMGPSPQAMEVAKQTLLESHRYPDSTYLELKQKLANFLSVIPEQITIGNGSENVLELIVKAYLRPPHDAAVVSQYAFLTIPFLIKSHGARTIVATAKNWEHDIDAMINAIDKNTRLLFLVNPNNPTGTYTNKIAFEALLARVPKHVMIVVDEAYSEYIHAADYPVTIPYLKHYSNLIITRTFSKIYGLAALRIGYAISAPDIAHTLNQVRLPFNVNFIAAKTALAALDDQEHIKKSVALNHAGMKQLEMGLQKLGLSFIASIGNFITIEVGNAVRIYQQLLAAGISVRPLQDYGMERYIRVSIGTSEQNEQFLREIEKII